MMGGINMDGKSMSFEKALGRLDEINNKLENGEVTLDESLRLFEEGMELSKYCRELLSSAAQRIEYVTGAGENVTGNGGVCGE